MGTDPSHHHSHTTSPSPSLNRLALSATVHCLTGCAIGEVLGMVIGTALNWSNAATIALSVVLMDAGLGSALFWGSLVFSLVVAGAAAFPANRWLIARGRGHAVVHRYHGHR